jgi:RNA polymerase sigma-70 factor (ECF subfamily)
MERVLPMERWSEQGEPGPTDRGPRAAEDADAFLLDRVRDGDGAAFERLVRRHQAAVLRVALRLAGDADVAEDLAQRAFLRALDGAGAFRGETGFRAWVLGIVVNLAKNHRRDAARFAPLPAEDRAAEPDDPADRLDLARRRERLRAAVDGLPARQREVLLLRIDGELPFAEVARALGVTENAAKVSFHLGVKRLKATLGSEEGR